MYAMAVQKLLLLQVLARALLATRQPGQWQLQTDAAHAVAAVAVLLLLLRLLQQLVWALLATPQLD
jgi:hypothetical protein